MKKFWMVLVAILLLTSVFSVSEAVVYNPPAECKGKLPHYLEGFKQTADQIDTFFQMQQNFNVSRVDSSDIGAIRGANLGESVKLTFYGHTLTLYLPSYQRVGNAVYYYAAAGSIKLGEQEFECVKADLRQWLQDAIDADYADHKMITEIAVKSFGEENGMTSEEVLKLLAKPISEYGTTYGDVLKIPILEPVNFINSVKYVYFTPMKSCNAAVYAKTVVAFTPCTRRWDYIVGYPVVAKHELIHSNSKLQGFPIGWYTNSELLAAFLPFLEQPTDLQTFFYHGYLSTPWEMLDVFGRWDIKKVRNEILRYRVPFQGRAMNREVLAGYLSEINEAAKWLRETGLQALAEFYKDPHFWVTVNDMSYDDDMAYKVIMAKNWEPTRLKKGHADTVKFILKHSDSSKDIARSAWARVGQKRGIGEEDEYRAKQLRELTKLAESFGLSQDELMKMGRAYGFKAEHFENIDIDFARKLINDFLRGEGMFRKNQEVR